jgi:DNA-directed RNA polymerase specialized sigma24 family protein
MLTSITEIIRERGPRYAITGTIRRGEFSAQYALTSESAEKVFEHYQELGYRNVKVHVPDVPGVDIDLASYGRALADARSVLEEKTQILRAAVLRATEAGRAEAEIARVAGIDRMTVRSWLGK